MKAAAALIIILMAVSAFTVRSYAFYPGEYTKTIVEPEGGVFFNDKGKTYFYSAEKKIVKNGLRIIDGDVYFLNRDGSVAKDVTMKLYNTEYVFGPDGKAVIDIVDSVKTPKESEKSEIAHKVDKYCDTVLEKITAKDMTKEEKVTEIYKWIRSNVGYQAGTEEDPDWYAEAAKGFRRKNGDCYTYWALAQAFFTRCGIECKTIIRNRDSNHYWHLVKVDDGNWYHVDCTPRSWHCETCLLTDKELLDLSAEKDYPPFEFALNQYPRTPYEHPGEAADKND